MTDPTDPPRLADAGSGALGDLVRACRQDVPSSAELGDLEARLVPLLWTGGPAGPAPGSGGAGASGAGAGVAKVLGALAIVAAGAGGALWATRGDEPPSPKPPAVQAVDVPTTTKAPEPEPALDTAEPPAQAESALPPETLAEPDPTPAKKAAPAKKVIPSEASLLESARRVLASDPKRALALVNQHRRLYPAGTLVQEREVLAIAALEKLGQDGAAEERADDFKRNFPGSAHQRKVDGVVEER